MSPSCFPPHAPIPGPRASRKGRGARQQGIALIIAMTMVIFLGILAAGLAYFMKIEITLARRASFESEAEWLGRSGIERGRHQIAAIARERTHNLGQRWAGGTGDTNDMGIPLAMENIQIGLGFIDKIHIEDLDRKLNVNTLAEDPLGRELLSQVLIQVVGDPVQSDALRDAIVDWVDPDDLEYGSSGAEKDYYLNLDPPYYAKNGRIDDMVEFLMIKGVNEAMFYGSSVQPVNTGPARNREFETISYSIGLKDVFTTLGVERKLVNVNTASAQILELVFGFPEAASEVITARNGLDGQLGTYDDGVNLGSLAALPAVGWALAQQASLPGQAGQRPGAPGAPGGGQANLLGLLSDRSAYFEIAVDVHVGNLRRTYYGTVDAARNPVEPVLLYMRWEETGAGPVASAE